MQILNKNSANIPYIPSERNSLHSCPLFQTNFFFFQRYKREFGFTIEHRPIIIDDVIVKGIAKSTVPKTVNQTIAVEDEPAMEKVNLYI